jgi:hypothetical protein
MEGKKMPVIALAALVIAIVGTICCAISHYYGGPLLTLGATLIGMALVLLALMAIGVGDDKSLLAPVLAAL